MRTGRAMVVAVPLTVLAMTTGCSFDPSAIPIPGTTVSGPKYSVQIQFANALNLPARAKVLANGAQIGTVADVRVVDPTPMAASPGGYVIVDVDVADSVQLPRSTRAELRQNTILGDIHISLTTPADGFGDLLPPNGMIPIEQTKAAIQIEDTMAGIATFVGGGAVTQLQDIVKRVNAILPADPRDTARIAETVGADVTDLAKNLDEVDVLLGGLTADSLAIRDNLAVVSNLLTPEAVGHLGDSVDSIVQVIGILGALGPIGRSVVWLGPLVTAGNAAAKAFAPLAFTSRPFDLEAPSNLNLLVALLRDKVIPFVEHGSNVNVVGLSTNDAHDKSPVSSDDQVAQILQALRMIGAVR